MELTLDPIAGYWGLGVTAALLAALPWMVPPQAQGLTPQRRRTLQILRSLAILTLLFMWARPTLTRVRTETIRPTLLMLFDASKSMSVEDALGGESRWNATRRLLDSSQTAVARLADKQEVQAFLFARELTPISHSGSSFALPTQPTGEQTAIGSALAEALDSASGRAEALSGVVLVSDGAQRARPPRDVLPLSVVSRLVAEGTPLYAIPVGQRATASQADLAVEDLAVSDAAFAGAPLEVGARLRVAGFPNRSARVRLMWEEANGAMVPVDAVQVVLRPGVEVYPITLRYAPPAPGEWKLSVVVDALEGETLVGNNSASTFVTVREGGIRVLYLAGANRTGGAPGLEQRFVRSSLAASPDVVVERLLINYKPLRRDLTDRLRRADFEVVVVDNVDAEGLSRSSWRTLAQLVESGAGFAMIGGRQSFGPGGHRDTLGAILPVLPGRAERQALDAPMRNDVHLPGPLAMVPRTAHPLTNFGADTQQLWAELPPLDGANRLGANLKPNAQVLLTTSGPRAEPLLVVGQPGLGRSLAFAGDSTWRWVLSGNRELHQRFWRQAVLWLAKKDDDPSATVFIDLPTRRVPAGSRIDLSVGVRRPDATEGNQIRYEAQVERPLGGAVELPLPGSGIRTTGVFTQTSSPGDYRVKVNAFEGMTPIGSAEARFHVPLRDLELERPGAEPDTLSRLAQATERDGGRTLAIEELPTLLNELAAQELAERREVVSRTTLYDTWPALLLFAGLITAEWLLRRQSGMP